jgi:hypothetical protein
MFRIRPALALAVALFLAGSSLAAQKVVNSKKGSGGSPHDTVEWTIDGATITIVYGRPFLKGRPLDRLTPAGQVWRTGADEATTLTTTRPLMFGALMFPAGSYTLYTVPGPSTWKLIVNKQTGQWGTEYHEDRDLGRVDMAVSKLDAPVEQFTIGIDDTPGGGVLKMDWGGVRAAVPFMVH